jgi:hypothetical protein
MLLFDELDRFLFAQPSKRLGTSMAAVQDIMHLEAADLALLVSIVPEAYNIEWRSVEHAFNTTQRKYALYVAVRLPEQGRPSIAGRQRAFQEAIDNILSSSSASSASAADDDESKRKKLWEGDVSVLPKRPANVSERTVSSSARQMKGSLAATAASAMAGSATNLGTKETVSLESLRAAAVRNSQNASAEDTQRKKEDAEAAATTRRQRLPQLCHLLRLIALSCNRSTMPLASLTKHLQAKGHVATPELHEEIDFLGTAVPEFVTIFPADDVIKEPTIRINLATQFTNMLARLNGQLAEEAAAAAATKKV